MKNVVLIYPKTIIFKLGKFIFYIGVEINEKLYSDKEFEQQFMISS